MDKEIVMCNSDRNYEIRDAIRLARSLVAGEVRLVKLRKLKAPQAVTSGALELIGERMAALPSDGLAERLLPQVRHLVTMRNERLDYLYEKTLVGRLYQEFGAWSMET
jgi:hypothetical protein